ncbi:hypothetical protein SAMN05443246_2998 [Paenibacillus sp. GP183]|jgi:hypothetical protein|nr:hypothetical protein SAMN05443246_2998 [Paenibacillus sp. GP183]
MVNLGKSRDLGFQKGCLWGIGLSIPLWFLLIYVLYKIFF